jgi:hypothetical protein
VIRKKREGGRLRFAFGQTRKGTLTINGCNNDLLKVTLPKITSSFPSDFLFRKKSSQPIERERDREREIELFFIYLFLFEREKERERLKSILITRQ